MEGKLLRALSNIQPASIPGRSHICTFIMHNNNNKRRRTAAARSFRVTGKEEDGEMTVISGIC